MNQPSFKKVAQLTRESATIAKQNEEMHKLAMQDVQLKAKYLEIERMKFESEKHADIKHQFNQCYDFAIRSLPWWKRSTKTVIDRATEIMLEIRREAAKHIAMRQAEYQAEQEAIAEALKQDEEIIAKGIVNTVSEDEKGHVSINATVKPDRETEEVETL